MRHARLTLAALLLITAPLLGAGTGNAETVHSAHGIAMHGEPKYGPDFPHFDYVNPDAPKGGMLRLHSIGSFDSLNPYIVRGQAPAGSTMPFETLLTSSADEAFTEYGLIAESVEYPEDRSWVAFTLRPEARWHDGQPITPEDVVFSLETLKSQGAPFFRFYYGSVAKAEVVGERKVRFTFTEGNNRELPLIVGQMPILPKHYWEGRNFEQTTLVPPLGSGPYRVAAFEPGRYVTYERVEDWWGKDLPVNRGHYNFDQIRYDYYRDGTVALEAFKAGQYDFRLENSAKDWATGYNFPAVHQGRVVLESLEHDRPAGMQAFVMNTRRPLFQDRRVRWALAHAFDFEWTNQALFYGQYTRSESYFANSELAAEGLPSEAELELLEPLREHLPEEVFTTAYHAPNTAEGGVRPNLRKAMALLEEAGWAIENGRLIHQETRQPFNFEILLVQPTFERVSLPFARNLQRLGIEARVRTVDSAQFKNRVDAYDFDMVVGSWGQSLSPGNEQREFWGSHSATLPGSRNIIGIQNPAIDTLIEHVIAAPDRESLITRTRALDRALLWGHYVIPQWHISYDRVAYWNKFGHPEKTPVQGTQLMTWWAKPDQIVQGSRRGVPAAPGLGGNIILAQETAPGPATEGTRQPPEGSASPGSVPPEGAGDHQPVPQDQTDPTFDLGDQPPPVGGTQAPVTPPGEETTAPAGQTQDLAPREAVPTPAAQEPGRSPIIWIVLILGIVAILVLRRMRGRRK
ncbi:extracellular solute-binding protein [Telmatospirillum sp. J64-1]|uniref:ABC transporter substrate-binding protein n=1 Tax=Telmatospirillum sp. J64-1 TaxID=2502183 RepID=UPI001C8F28CB